MPRSRRLSHAQSGDRLAARLEVEEGVVAIVASPASCERVSSRRILAKSDFLVLGLLAGYDSRPLSLILGDGHWN
jgi:hypothetical protein